MIQCSLEEFLTIGVLKCFKNAYRLMEVNVIPHELRKVEIGVRTLSDGGLHLLWSIVGTQYVVSFIYSVFHSPYSWQSMHVLSSNLYSYGLHGLQFPEQQTPPSVSSTLPEPHFVGHEDTGGIK